MPTLTILISEHKLGYSSRGIGIHGKKKIEFHAVCSPATHTSHRRCRLVVMRSTKLRPSALGKPWTCSVSFSSSFTSHLSNFLQSSISCPVLGTTSTCTCQSLFMCPSGTHESELHICSQAVPITPTSFYIAIFPFFKSRLRTCPSLLSRT